MAGRSFDDDAWQLERAQRLRMALFDMHKPVIAQVQGYCLAGGTDLATLSDIIICADDARFGFPPGRDLGVLPTQMWLYHVGPQWAKRLLLTGDTVNGAEAAQIGLALKSVPADLLAAEVDGLARRLTLVDRELLAANKRAINLGLELMGARTMQRLAAEIDARGHLVESAAGFRRDAAEHGLREALRRRDAPFGDGRARVNGPELRDEHGALIDPEPGLTTAFTARFVAPGATGSPEKRIGRSRSGRSGAQERADACGDAVGFVDPRRVAGVDHQLELGRGQLAHEPAGDGRAAHRVVHAPQEQGGRRHAAEHRRREQRGIVEAAQRGRGAARRRSRCATWRCPGGATGTRRARRRRTRPTRAARRRPIWRSSARTIRSFGRMRVINRPMTGCIASRIMRGVDSTGAPNGQPSSTSRRNRSGWAAAPRSMK